MPGDVFYTVENMRLGVGEMEAFLVDVLAGERPVYDVIVVALCHRAQNVFLGSLAVE